MVSVNPLGNKQGTPLILVITGLACCAFAEHFGFRDLVTIAIATNAAGLALLTQHHTSVTNKDGGTTTIESTTEEVTGAFSATKQ